MQITHPQLVAVLKKNGSDIIAGLTPEKADLIHMAIGVCGEAGELADALKKFGIYNKPLDRENVIEELGDLEFFLEGIRQRLNITREDTLAHNIGKLRDRYKSLTYTDEAAINREDKNGNA